MRLAWLLLLFIAPVAAIGEDINLNVTPETAEAPGEFAFRVAVTEARDATWNLTAVLTDGMPTGNGTVVAAGAQLPAQGTFELSAAGTYQLTLHVDDGGTDVARVAIVQVMDPTPTEDVVWFDGSAMPLMFAGLLMVALAIWLLAEGKATPLNVAFGLLFIGRGLADIALSLWTNPGHINIRPDGLLGDLTGGGIAHVLPISSVFAVFAALYFLYSFLAQNQVRLASARKPVSIALFATALLLVIAYLIWPSRLWWNAETGLPGGPLFIFTGLYYPLYAIFGLLLIRSSTQKMPDDRRTGLYLAGLGFIFLPVFEAVGSFLYIEILDVFDIILAGQLTRADLGLAFEIGHWATVSAIVPAIIAAVYLGRDAIRNPTRRHVRLHFAGYMLTLLLPLCSLAFGLVAFQGPQPESAQAAVATFVIFQGIWTIPYPVFVALGLIRYQAAERQDSMRRNLKRFGLASIFFTVFFTVSEGLEALASAEFSQEVGLASAGALTLLLNPVQNLVQKRFIQPTAVPEAETPQELSFYQEQLRRTLADGQVGTAERHFLENLRATMGITTETAHALEVQLIREMASLASKQGQRG